MKALHMSATIKCPGHSLLASLVSHVLAFSPYFLSCLCFLSWLSPQPYLSVGLTFQPYLFFIYTCSLGNFIHFKGFIYWWPPVYIFKPKNSSRSTLTCLPSSLTAIPGCFQSISNLTCSKENHCFPLSPSVSVPVSPIPFNDTRIY